MAKLTDTQLIVLSKAAQRDDGCAQLPEGLPKAASRKLGAALVARKLMREVRSKPGMPVWGNDHEDRPISLVILKAGRHAIGVENDAASPAPRPAAKTGVATEADRGAKSKPIRLSEGEAVDASAPASKRSQVIGMLSTPGGTTLPELVAATGWLTHTARAVLTGLRKKGYSIDRQRPEGVSVSTYRIVRQISKA